MKVFVAGGTGAVGRPSVQTLVRAGHDISALARSDDSERWLRDSGAWPVRASIFNADELARAFAGHGAVVNLATAIPPTHLFFIRRAWAANERIRREGSAAIVDAAIAAGVPRVVQESVVMLYPDRGSAWIDEDVEPERFALSEGNLAAEASAHRFGGAGGERVVLRFGLFYGPTAAHSQLMFKMARAGLAVMLGRPASFVSSIHMTDAGAAVVAALAAPAGVYNIVDDEPLTKTAYADAMARAAGRRRALRAPGRLALLLGSRSTSLTRSVRASNRRFRTATGWSPRYPSAREGLNTMAHELRRANPVP